MSKRWRGRVTRWVWDGDKPLHEWQELVVGPGAGSASEVLTWLFEEDSFAPLAKLTANGAQSVVCDHLGTPLTLHDEQGAVTWALTLDSYGGVRQGRGKPQDCPFRYPGQYEDTETGLYYNRFRYYDPEAGQYISQDPAGLAGGYALYNYVHNPTTWTDTLGLLGKPIIVIGEGQSKVNKVARGLKAQGHEVRTITDDWAKEFKIYSDYKPELHEAQSIDYNRRWINQRMDEGYEILDIGGQGKSGFYKAEHEEIIKRAYDKHFRYDPQSQSRTRISRIKKCGIA